MVNVLEDLYHVSATPRELSWQPSLKSKTWDDATKEEIETALDAQRPAQAPSRRKSYFAFRTIDECVYYADSEGIGPERYFYIVKLTGAVRAPIKIIAVPPALLPYRDAVYRHYWNPDDGWKIYELFGERMIVRDEYKGAIPDAGHVLAKLVDDRNRLMQLAATWR